MRRRGFAPFALLCSFSVETVERLEGVSSPQPVVWQPPNSQQVSILQLSGWWKENSDANRKIFFVARMMIMATVMITIMIIIMII
jgi:hypothetical protein